MSKSSAILSKNTTLLIIVVILVISNLGVGSLYLTEKESTKATTSELNTAKTTLDEAEERIARQEADLELAMNQLSDRELALEEEKNRNAEFEDQIRRISGTVGILDRLAKTDKELLEKYSRVYFLNENYVPSSLEQIDKDFILPGRSDQYFHGDAVSFLERMLEDAKDDGHDLRVVSAYRSFDTQRELKNNYTQIYGSGANAFSADQGYSEHQLGTAADIVDTSTAALVESFANTDAYAWLQDNAHDYGFILSYPKNNQYYIFEPWHWRFVGRDLARDLKRDDANFYDWDQRKIDEYLVDIFE